MTSSTDGKPQPDADGPTPDEIAFACWVNRIFANWDAYEASLPSRKWIKGSSGWYSVER
jgi:hypothetical protein